MQQVHMLEYYTTMIEETEEKINRTELRNQAEFSRSVPAVLLMRELN